MTNFWTRVDQNQVNKLQSNLIYIKSKKIQEILSAKPYLHNYLILFMELHQTGIPPPYSLSEINHSYPATTGLLQQMDEITNANEFFICLGMRITEGSSTTWEDLPPTLDTLLNNAVTMYNEYLTHAARAAAKHSYRCKVNYWGNVSGNPTIQNEYARELIIKILSNFTWWNIYFHSKHGKIIEFRDKTGHGVRWILEPLQFLGLVEPIDPQKGRLFFQNYKNYLKSINEP